MSSPTNNSIALLADNNMVKKQNSNDFFIDSDKCIYTTIDDCAEVPCEMQEAACKAIPMAQYNRADKLLSQKGHVEDFGSDKSIVSLNSDNQSSRNLESEDADQFAQPLCAFRRYAQKPINQLNDIQYDDDSSDIFALSESSVSESMHSLLSMSESCAKF